MATFTKDEIVIGPGKLFWDVPPPARDEYVTIDSEGYPVDGTLARVGVLAGYTKEGTTFTRSLEVLGIKADQLARPVARVIQRETVAISGTLVQLANQTNLRALLPGSSAEAEGAETRPVVTFGGVRFVEPSEARSVTVTFADPLIGGYAYLMIYRAYNWQDFSFQITRRNPAEAEFRFEGDPVEERWRGDWTGRIYIY